MKVEGSGVSSKNSSQEFYLQALYLLSYIHIIWNFKLDSRTNFAFFSDAGQRPWAITFVSRCTPFPGSMESQYIYFGYILFNCVYAAFNPTDRKAKQKENKNLPS